MAAASQGLQSGGKLGLASFIHIDLSTIYSYCFYSSALAFVSVRRAPAHGGSVDAVEPLCGQVLRGKQSQCGGIGSG